MSEFHNVNFWGPTSLVLPRGYVLLLVSSPNVGKTEYGLRFLIDGVKQGESGVFISLNNTKADIQKTLEELGYGEDGKIKIIDYFLSRAKPSQIDDLSMELNRLLDDAHSSSRFVIDSLCTLGLMIEPDIFPAWVLKQRANVKMRAERGQGSLILMNWTTGIHRQEITNALRNIVDGVLEMRFTETEKGELNRFIRIFMLRGIKYKTAWSAIQFD
ncbi:MAG: hypothetical protein GTN80_09060 [Nitrososphaeria archaeon]|nr:hypothetical protein [Nitrososphaeria archaeon]NIN53315.1 hypothetical protein [Nitrososphaeria archaeon]NIQ33768.1 hypothetical protein [Nitrososphaeria archaeon]